MSVIKERVKNGEWVQRKDSLDFGELDEILDDLSSKQVSINFDSNRKLKSIFVYSDSMINNHIIDKMKKLWNLNFQYAEPEDDVLKMLFAYNGEYVNKAEVRKEEESKRSDFSVSKAMERFHDKINDDLIARSELSRDS
jgi:hypothetical protein